MSDIYGPGKDDYGRDKWLSEELITKIKNILMKPTIGRIVIYYPQKSERELLNNYLTKAPAIITAVWSDTCINLKVLCDGPFNLWKTSVNKFDSNINGTPFTENVWDWPNITE